MKLVSFRISNEVRLGVLFRERIIDLNLAYSFFLSKKGEAFPIGKALEEIPPAMIPFLEQGSAGIERAKDLLATIGSDGDYTNKEFERFSYSINAVRLLAPVPHPRKIVVVGLNYAAHVKESQVEIPDWPWTFGKFSSVLIGPGDSIGYTPLINGLDGEVELGVIIGKRGKYVSEEQALSYVAGYSIFNDVSARNIQFEGQAGLRFFYLGKNFQDSAVLGPCLATADELPDPHQLDMSMYYNERLVRQGNTSNYIFRVEELISFYSRFFTLEPGDVIAAGCPPAVQKRDRHIFFDKDYRFLQPGDTCICEIQGLGTLQNPIVEVKMGPLSVIN
jgi:acylpyruvate hydrolase